MSAMTSLGAMAGDARRPLDVLVVGGGLAGAAAAMELARAGRSVVVVEKMARAHDKVCGEFLSAEAIRDLRELGVDPAALGAVSIERARLAGRLGVREVRLPFEAMSLSRRVLDEALLMRAAACGASVVRGCSVEELRRGARGWCAEVAGQNGIETVEAENIVLASGKHDVRGLARPGGVQSDLVAFKMYFRLARGQSAKFEGAVELALFHGGYCGLQLVEDGAANVCCVVRKSVLRELGGGWEGLLRAMLRGNALMRERLEGAKPVFARPAAIGSIPYGFVRREAIAEGAWAVGDQAAVIPSFTGDGMSLALRSGRMAARMLVEGRSTAEYQRTFSEQVRRQVALATAVSRALVVEIPRAVAELAVCAWPGVMRHVAAGTRLREADYGTGRIENSCAAI
ncbi:MAG TPA: FAD-dependent oxidoreductase [Acidobacteriaceae bacterium]|jgi:flavin-dependent dehydrogenase|nr:FAD-dependent oxidoreductase [Acidobacteriaceae bacterium]